MFFRNAAALFLTIGSLSRDAIAELITITQYPSTCSAIYTTGTRSITIVQSTVTVVPVPYDDAAWNGGTPFVLEIELGSTTDPLARRVPADLAGRSWVALNGNTSTDPLMAGQYYIRNGQLMSVNGSYLSTNLNVQNQPFAIMNTPGSISTTFTFRDGVLNWTSPRFTDGRAKWCKLPASQVDSAQVLAQFLGPVYAAQSCAPIRFRARPCSEVNPLSSTSSILPATGSVSSSIPGQSTPSGPSVTYNPPPYTYQPVSSSSSAPGPSISTPPPPYIDSTSSRAGPSSSSSRSLSSPAAYTSASTPTSFPSLTPYTRTSSSASSSASQPPIYGSVTPSPSQSSSSSTSSVQFASSGSPLGPINPPIYGSTASSSSSVSSSMSISSGGVRSSETSSSSSSTSSVSLPPIYSTPTASSSSTSVSTTLPAIISIVSSGSRSSSSSSVSTTLPAIISIVSSGSRSPSSTPSSTSSSQSPPVVYPDGSTSSAPASSTSSSQSPPVVYPDGPTSSSPVQTSSTSALASSSSAVVNPPLYTSEPQPCPQGNNSVYIDTAGFAYTIYCATDSLPPSTQAVLYLDFPSCIQRCDFDPLCGAAAHLGENSCYLKPTPLSYFPGSAELKIAVRLSGTPPIYTGASSTSSSSSMRSSSSSSTEIPQQYETTSSSSSAGQSTTSSSSSSSSMVMSSSTTSSSSSSSSEVPSEYQGPTTNTTTASTSSSSSSSSVSTSSEVPTQYDQMTTSSSGSSSTSSSSSAELPDQYESTTSSSSSSSFPTTTTTSSSSSSSSAASSTIPYSSYLVLPSPTSCDFGDPPDYDEDDSYCEIDLPFPIVLFGVESQRTFAASNGIVSLNRGSSQWQVRQFPNTAIPDLTVAPFYDDLYLYGRKQPRQGIYYQVEGGKVTYEWYVGRATTIEADKPRLSQSIYHFTMEYDSATNNTFVYTYYAVGNAARDDGGVNGAFAAVGLQAKDADGTTRATTYSFRNAQITPGSQVRCTLSQTVNECIKVTNPLIVVGIGGLGG